MASRVVVDESLIEEMVALIRRRGWRLPALLGLEAGRPLTFLGGQLLWAAQPIFGSFVSGDLLARMATLLEEPAAVDALIARLEEGA